VLEAGDRSEGTRLFRDNRPSVVFLDIDLPGNDGIEAASEILTIDPDASMFIIGGIDEIDNHRVVAGVLRARGGFTKPAKVSEILNAANEITSHRKVAPPWKPDPNRIHRNPYDFKSDEAERRATLAGDLEFMAHFFDYPSEDLFHAAVNNYIGRRGDAGFLALTFAVRHVQDMENEIEFIRRCTGHHVVYRIDRIRILLHIALIELVEKGRYISFGEFLQGRLNEGACPRPKDTEPSSLKEWLALLSEEYLDQQGASRAFQQALSGGLTTGEQMRLLQAFAFSKEYNLGSPSPEPRHLHCADRASRGFPLEPFCTSHCQRATDDETTRLMPRLAGRFYDMRSAFVHNASGVGFAAIADKLFEGSGGRTLFDVFMTRNDRLIRYHVTIDVLELVRVLRQCIWTRLSTAGS